MGRQDKVDLHRSDREYATDQDDEEDDVEEDMEEDEGDGAGSLPEKEDENFSQECQEYYERRERLKELERQKFRRSNDNGRSHAKTTNKPLPYDNYGSFFGPSEPVVARRIIADARAREDASKVAARQTKEISEQHRISKGPSGMSKSVSDSKVTETVKHSKSSNEAALKLQRLKEARDYSFLFTDEDPTASVPHDHGPATKKGSQENDRPKQATPSVKGMSAVAQRVSNSAKPSVPTSAKPSLGAKVTKASVSTVSKGQERHPNPSAKFSKPPERPTMSKAKVSSHSGSNLNSNKTISGPGRPPQDRRIVSTSGISNGKKPLSSSAAVQLKSLVASGPGRQSVPSTSAKVTPGKGAPQKSVPAGNLVKKLPQLPGIKSQVSTSRPEQKRPGVVTVGRGSSTDQRRPAQPAATSKQVTKPPARVQKRPRESESEDSFLDDEEDEGDVRSMIRKMFNYNPNKYRDLDDEDDRFMETNFHSLQMEEKRSARIAREEDDRELALIEEEERREREMARKKRKQQR